MSFTSTSTPGRLQQSDTGRDATRACKRAGRSRGGYAAGDAGSRGSSIGAATATVGAVVAAAAAAAAAGPYTVQPFMNSSGLSVSAWSRAQAIASPTVSCCRRACEAGVGSGSGSPQGRDPAIKWPANWARAPTLDVRARRHQHLRRGKPCRPSSGITVPGCHCAAVCWPPTTSGCRIGAPCHHCNTGRAAPRLLGCRIASRTHAGMS